MAKLLAIPNDAIEAYYRNSEEDFLGEFNPINEGSGRFFDEVSFLNWKDKFNEEYCGVKSFSFLEDKTVALAMMESLSRGYRKFISPLFAEIFEQDKMAIRNVVESVEPDVVRAFNTHFAAELGSMISAEYEIPLVVSAHDPTRLTSVILEADALVCESYELRDLCIEKFGVDSRRISVIHNGIDQNYFSSKTNNEIVRFVSDEFLDAPYKIFSSSRLVRGKNIGILLEALFLVKDELPGLVHLHLGAEGSQPEEIANIMEFRKKYDLENISYFLGAKQKNELPAYYSWADVFVLPTLWEGLSRVMRESLSCGTPVIATNYGSSSEIIQTGYNGVSVNPGSSEEIASGLLKILKDEKFKRSLERNARPSVEKYSLSRSMKMYSDLYNKMINSQ